MIKDIYSKNLMKLNFENDLDFTGSAKVEKPQQTLTPEEQREKADALSKKFDIDPSKNLTVKGELSKVEAELTAARLEDKLGISNRKRTVRELEDLRESLRNKAQEEDSRALDSALSRNGTN